MMRFVAAIAELSEKHKDLLVPDEGCEYDQLIELNLDEVCVLENYLESLEQKFKKIFKKISEKDKYCEFSWDYN